MHDDIEACSQVVRSRLGGGSVAAAGLLACSVLASAAIVSLGSEWDRMLGEFDIFLFSRDIVGDAPARVYILFWVTRKLPLLPLTLLLGAMVAAPVGYVTHLAFDRVGAGQRHAGHASRALVLALCAGSMLLSDHACRTLQRWLPVPWELHKVHHPAEVIVGTIKRRINPVDEIMNKAWDGLRAYSLYGLWMSQFADPMELTILGINIDRVR